VVKQKKEYLMTAEFVIHYLKQRWSPEQVSGRIKISHNIKISHERIYQFIYKDKPGGLLHQYLCVERKIS